MLALIAGNSHPSGPNRGIVIKAPTLFGTGFVNEHRVSLASAESQVGLMMVRPKQAFRIHFEQVFVEMRTFEIGFRSPDDFVINHKVRRRSTDEH